ncbi:MAG: DNA polymerase IV [Ignavibacteriae bacterium]|nr:DNA polymerase IV [Ignavibacteriota bacterium]
MHLDMDTFFVSVERLLDPALIGRPVIVGGSPYQRGVVAGCSREARLYGIHSAMPLRRAYELCPEAVFLHPNFTHYAEYSERVAELLADAVPVLEKASIDEFYLDLSGCDRALGDENTWTSRLKRDITGELHLPLTYGVARNKLVAKVATTVGKRAGDLRVPAGGEAGFLAPHPVRLLPGVGEVLERELLSMGVHYIGDIARLGGRLLTHMYGRNGRSLHEHARGIDESPIRPYRRQKSLGAEHTYDEDVLEPRLVLATLKRLAQRIGADLRAHRFLARTVTVKLRYADFVTVTRTSHCDYTNADHILYRIAERTFDALYTRRVRVRLVGISTSDFIEDYEQIFLFSEEEEKYDRLYHGLDAIRARFGKYAITYGSVLEERS